MITIPYFQRSEGILRKALASVSAQLPAGMPVHIIVVDDESPARSAPEIASVTDPHYSIELILQTNTGPAAARNNGLQHAPAGTRFIAFLDSDDEWTPDHLQRAVQALDAGFDFYFADHIQLGATVGAFRRNAQINYEMHPQIAGVAAGIHRFNGSLVDQTIRGNLVGTSTVVCRFSDLDGKRFREEFTNAGEDYVFWMELARSGARVAFSRQCEALYGRGVNIYAGSGWGTDHHMLRIHNEMKYRKLTGQLFPLNALQKRHIGRCVRDLRLAFARDVFHRVIRRKPLPWQVLKRQLKLDPLSFLGLPLTLPHTLVFRN